MATEEMVMEYTEKRRQDLEDLCKFNIAAGTHTDATPPPPEGPHYS
jgi:hypothetical protein